MYVVGIISRKMCQISQEKQKWHLSDEFCTKNYRIVLIRCSESSCYKANFKIFHVKKERVFLTFKNIVHKTSKWISSSSFKKTKLRLLHFLTEDKNPPLRTHFD